jgi:hypothetical protein
LKGFTRGSQGQVSDPRLPESSLNSASSTSGYITTGAACLTFGSLWKEEMTFGRNEGVKPHFKKVISNENDATK